MSSDDEDTPPIGLPVAADHRARESATRELSPATSSLSKRWQRRTYEFATPDAALVYTACTMAVSLVTGVWPVVEVHRQRVSVRLPGEAEPGAGERLTMRELSSWARNLGAREVARTDVT